MEKPETNVLPTKLVKAARAVTAVGSDVFLYGGYPKLQLEEASKAARRKWILACKFDQALRNYFPNLSTPHEFVRIVGNADAALAESAWLEAIWLWPDRVEQQDAANRIWLLGEDGTADEGAVRARVKIAQLQGDFRRLQKTKPRGRFRKKVQALERQLNNPSLRQCAGLDGPHLHSELWIRYVALKARDEAQTPKTNWRRKAREALARLVPKASGRELGYNPLGVAMVYIECYRWVRKERTKRDRAFQRMGRPSAHDEACGMASQALNAIGYRNAPSPRQIRRLVESQNLRSLRRN